MLTKIILSLVPRSPRASVAMVIMLASLGVMALSLGGLSHQDPAADDIVKFFAGAALGIPATVVFYYFQFADDKPKRFDEVEFLNSVAEAERKKDTRLDRPRPPYDTD